MKTSRKLLLTGTVGALIPLALYASDQVNGMYNFVDGEPILTEEVNENFQHLAGLINSTDNVAHISVDEETGNVGIGTTSPGVKLTVNGGEISAILLDDTTGQTDPSTVRGMAIRNDSTLPGTGVGLKFLSNIYGGASAGVSGEATSSDNMALRFWTEGAGGGRATRMYLASNGNVGIGTTAPSAALDVVRSGTNDPIALFGSTGLTDEQALTVKNGSGGISLFAQGGNGTFLTGATQGDVGIRFTADDDFHIGQERTPLLTIKSGGNVGIGTTDPSYMLDVWAPGENVTIDSNSGDGVNDNSFDNLIMMGAGNRRVRFGYKSGLGSTGRFVVQTSADGGVTFPDRLLIDSNGNVGIGTLSPSERLHVIGKVSADDYLNNSDLRLKTDISPLENASEGIACLQGVTYRWNDPASSQDLQIGLIAQDVERCFPEVVTTNSDGYKSVSYARLVAPLIENAKEQQALDASQQLAIARLKAELATTNARLAKLEALLNSRR